MSSFFAYWAAPMARYGWLLAAVIVLVLIAAFVWTRKGQGGGKPQSHWAADDNHGFAATVMVDSTEVTTWRAASKQDMPPPRPAGPIRVVSPTTMPVPLNESPGSS